MIIDIKLSILAVFSLLVICIGMYHRHQCFSKIQIHVSELDYEPLKTQKLSEVNINDETSVLSGNKLNFSNKIEEGYTYAEKMCTGRYD